MVDRDGKLERGRHAFAESAWLQAYDALALADASSSLAPPDLERLGRSAYMIGRDDDYVAAFERAHHAYLGVEDTRAAVRCSFWIGHNLLFRGEAARASGWFARGQRFLEREGTECVERGYLLQARMIEHEFSADFDAALAVATEIAAIGERFGDRDLVAIALMAQGHFLIRLRRRAEGVRLVDEAMIAATVGELTPIVQRDCVLLHDFILPRRLRAAPCPGVDGTPSAGGATLSRRWWPTRGCAWSTGPSS